MLKNKPSNPIISYNTKEEMHKQQQSTHPHFHHRGEHSISLDHYKHAKLYSHIADEYNFRIGNKLMAQKIIKPRRDKTIMDSLIHASPKYILRKKKIVPREIRQANDRRNDIQREPSKNSDSRSQINEIRQFRSKRNKRSKIGVLRSMDQAIQMNNQLPPSRQKQRQETLSDKVQTRDCSLRNNFVGKIVKNQRRQALLQNQKHSISSMGIKLFNQVVRSQILAEADENRSFYDKSDQQSNKLKNRLLERINHNKTREHFRHFTTQKLKENNACYKPMEANSRVLNTLL